MSLRCAHSIRKMRTASNVVDERAGSGATASAGGMLAALRRGADAAQSVWDALAYQADEREPSGQQRATSNRAGVTLALAESIQPSDAPIARRLLREEIAAHEAAGTGAGDTLYTLVAVVARFADPRDALLLWRARQATPETRAGVDVEQFGRLGLDPVRNELRRLAATSGVEAEQARQALAWIAQGEQDGAFDTLAEYLTWSDERYGLGVSGPT